MCPGLQRLTGPHPRPCLNGVARQLLRGSWHGPRSSRPGYPQTRCWTHVFMAGSRSFAASRSTRHMVVKTLALLVRWYSAIIQLTWFPCLRASRGRISGCKCLMAQPHHPEGTAAPQHTHKVSQRRQASPPCPEGEREVLAQSPISLIGNGGVSGAWPIGIWPQHSFPLVQPKSGRLPLHLSPSEQVYQGRRDP